MNKKKIIGLLGLAMRARKIVLGQEFVIKTMKDEHVLLFLADDSGENIKKKIIYLAVVF